MDITKYYWNEGEKPLDCIKTDGGFFSIFRRVACIGDSLSSGEMESLDEAGNRGYHDMFEYSWGQYMARAAGVEVLNFSRGGMTAEEYCKSFAEANGFWDPKLACQCYIIALGVNDILGRKMPLGSTDDICLEDPEKNADTFAGWYGKIIQRYKQIAPKAKFFLVGFPRVRHYIDKCVAVTDLFYKFSEFFENTYTIDLFRYAPEHDEKFAKTFYLGGHLNAMGYKLTGLQIMSYIDFIIRKNPEDFAQVAFTPADGPHNVQYKW